MKPSVIKLVDVILKRIEEHPDLAPSESGIRSWLAGQGYNKRDIDAAIKLARPHLDVRPAVHVRNPAPLRMLSSFEEQKLTEEARAALARLEYYQLISPFERETLLDRLNHFDGVVGLDELDYLLTWLVCSGRDYESQHTIYSVFEGDGETFH